MEHNSAMKRTELLLHITAWVDLKGMMLSDKKPTSKCPILHGSICITFWKYHAENRVVADRCQGLGRKGGGCGFQGAE